MRTCNIYHVSTGRHHIHPLFAKTERHSLSVSNTPRPTHEKDNLHFSPDLDASPHRKPSRFRRTSFLRAPLPRYVQIFAVCEPNVRRKGRIRIRASGKKNKLFLSYSYGIYGSPAEEL
ncbi:hypothetical protein Trydic_g3799 [Trypoxylus dichotomus]